MVPPFCFLGDLIGAGNFNIGWGDYDLIDRQPMLNISCSGGGHPLGGHIQLAFKGGLDQDMCFNRGAVLGCTPARLAELPAGGSCVGPGITWEYNLLVAWDHDTTFPQVGWHYYLFFLNTPA